MATIRLHRREVGDEQLPPVCMRCGEPAVDYVRKNFSWFPGWVWAIMLLSLLIGAIIAMVLTKRMRVHGPFCELHRRHWRNTTLLIVGGLLLTVALVGSAIAYSVTEDERPHARGNETGPYVCLGAAVVGLAYVIAAVVVQGRSVHATKITDNTITLTRVSPLFVDAVEDQRDEDEEAYESRRAARLRRRLEEDEDDEGERRPDRREYDELDE